MIEEYYNNISSYLAESLGANFILIIITLTTVGSLLYFIVITYIITQMDKAYFIRKKNSVGQSQNKRTENLLSNSLSYALEFAKTIIGVFLLALGILMLVLPGQGLITMLIGLSLIPFPGKNRLELNLLSRKSVRTSLNWIREKASKEPFIFD